LQLSDSSSSFEASVCWLAEWNSVFADGGSSRDIRRVDEGGEVVVAAGGRLSSMAISNRKVRSEKFYITFANTSVS
jgi:hypothetical protein